MITSIVNVKNHIFRCNTYGMYTMHAGRNKHLIAADKALQQQLVDKPTTFVNAPKGNFTSFLDSGVLKEGGNRGSDRSGKWEAHQR